MQQFVTDGLHTVKILSGEAKTVTVRYPTDAEWAEKAARVRTVIHDLGRGKSKPETIGLDAASLDLYQKIRAEGSPDLTAAEARAVLNRLEEIELSKIELISNEFIVNMIARGIALEHRLRMPSLEQVDEYGKSHLPLMGIRRGQEIRSLLEPAGALYGKLVVATSGYAGAVPLPHKASVLYEVTQEMDRLIHEGEDPER